MEMLCKAEAGIHVCVGWGCVKGNRVAERCVWGGGGGGLQEW